MLRQLPAPDIPRVVVTSQCPMRHLHPLDFYWSLWGPANVTDVEALADRIRRWLGFGKAQVGPVRVEDVVERVRRYLASHPYVGKLILNFVQPGAASLVLDLLMALQNDPSTASLRYVVRLFSSDTELTDLGRTLDDFMADPEAARTVNKDAADTFLASGEDPLAPKLTYSKHNVESLRRIPEAYPAHLTFFLDWFSLRVVPAPTVVSRRSAYAPAYFSIRSWSFGRATRAQRRSGTSRWPSTRRTRFFAPTRHATRHRWSPRLGSCRRHTHRSTRSRPRESRHSRPWYTARRTG